MKYDIFISYRRDGGYETAKHLYDLLDRDGYSVSFDIDTLRNGDFDTTLLNRIDECTDFILVLDAHAFDRTLDPNFPREKDWLYQELSYAMMKNKNIIPVMLSGFSFPDNLPDDIVKVQKKNGPKYDKYYFDEFYKRLKTVFFETPVPKLPATISNISNSPITFVLKITVDETSMLYIDDKKIRKIRQGTTAYINTLKYGYKYKITLKNLAINQQEYTIEYEVPDKREGDEINVEFKTMREQRIATEKEEKLKNAELKEKRSALLYALRTLCRENYDWFDNICFNTIRVENNGKFGFLDINGIEIVPCLLKDARNFEGEYAYVCNGNKWGIINNSGQLVIDFICDLPSWISNGFTALLQDGQQKLTNLQNPQNLYGPYDEVIVTENSNRFVIRTEQSYFIIDGCNNRLNNDSFDGFSNDNRELINKREEIITFPLIVTRKRRGWINNLDNSQTEPNLFGVVDQDGKYIIPCKMEDIEHVNFVQGGCLRKHTFKIKTNSYYGIYDTAVNSYLIPPIYKELIPSNFFVNELTSWYACDNNGKWGAVDTCNVEIVPFKYDDCQSYSGWGWNIRYHIHTHEERVYFGGIGNSSCVFFKLLSDDRFSLRIENEDWFDYTIEQYKCCIIDFPDRISKHVIVSYPFIIYESWRKEGFCSKLIEPSNESLSENLCRIKDDYYNACCDLYGAGAANEFLEKLMQCTEEEKTIDNPNSISIQSILKNANDKGQTEVLFPEISIICSESSDYAYRALSEEVNHIQDIFSQNGVTCKYKKTEIVLLTQSIYKDEAIIERINEIIKKPKQLIFIGNIIWSVNKPQLDQWTSNQTFYDTWNVISDKEILVLKIIALLNGWDGAESGSI